MIFYSIDPVLKIFPQKTFLLFFLSVYHAKLYFCFTYTDKAFECALLSYLIMRPTQTGLHAPWMYEFDNESFMKFLNKGSHLAI